MAIKRLVFCLCLLGYSCAQKIAPEVAIQQVTKPLSYYLPPEYDITFEQAQDWLTQHEYKRLGSYVVEKQLDWKSAEDLGFFLEVPFKPMYRGPKISDLFNNEELIKLNQVRTEWYFTIGKSNNEYQFFISGLVPSKGFTKTYSKQSLLECAKRKNGIYSGLWLNFDRNGKLVSGMEMINGRGSIVDTSSRRFPSTELEEIRQEIYNNSANSK